MKTISVFKIAGSFAENKDLAAKMRDEQILPRVKAEEQIEVDFSEVTLTTQSFIHALISEPLRVKGESALEYLSFRGCNQSIRGIIETVVQYVLETVEDGG